MSIISPTNERFILVYGKAEQEIEPNIIELSVVITTSNSKSETELKKKESDMVALLKAAKVDMGLVTMDRYGAYKSLGFSLSKTHKSVLSKGYRIILRDLDTFEALAPLLFEAGMSHINVARFDHTEIEKYKSGLTDTALDNAREKAQKMAERMNLKVAGVLSITEQSEVPFNDPFAPRYYAAGGAGASDSSVGLDKIRLKKVVEVKFSISD